MDLTEMAADELREGKRVQGDPSGLSKPIVDIDVKVAF